ncbi:MAG: hypothetical protein LWX07_07490 [Bacteroidetes bacterium]|nr:hypothetical protein [Bacteroidota bacterium]
MRKILFICGSMNQTTMMHGISAHLGEGYDCYFTPYYTDGFKGILVNAGLLDFTILGGKFRRNTTEYLFRNNLKVDYKGTLNEYDLVVTCTDLIIQKNIKRKKIILIQEGMTDPENLFFYLSKYVKFPRYFASTSTTGLSDAYVSFCTASEGYRDLFVKKGCNPDKIRVTGIPNFDNCISYTKNRFPYKNYVLVCTSDTRETLRYENRKKFINNAVKIAAGRQLIFKLHPNENHEKAEKEIKELSPDALVFAEANTNELIANCSVLITKYSSVVYVGLALGKEVYSDFNIEELKKMVPIQNNGSSAKNIAAVCEYHLNGREEREYGAAELIPLAEQY